MSPERKVFDVNIDRSPLLEKLATGSQRSAPISQWVRLVRNMRGFMQEERDLVCIGFFKAGDDLSERCEVERIVECGYRELRKCVPTVSSFLLREFKPTVGVKAVLGELPRNVEPRARRFVEAAKVCFKHPSFGFWVVKTGYEDLVTAAPNWIVLDNMGRLLADPVNGYAWFQSDAKALDVMHLAIRRRFKKYPSEHAFLLFDRFTLPDGNNHQEWLVHLPHWPHRFEGNHFPIDNLIVHIRTTERKTISGEQILFVEEIQSDWHAAVRRAKATNSLDAAVQQAPVHAPPFRRSWHELGVKVALSIASKLGYRSVGFTNARMQTDRWGSLEGLRRLYDQNIPNTLDAVAKKHNCVLRWEGIITRERNLKVRPAGVGEWIVSVDRGDSVTPRLRLNAVAEYYANRRNKVVSERVRVLTISESLDTILGANALPLFGW